MRTQGFKSSSPHTHTRLVLPLTPLTACPKNAVMRPRLRPLAPASLPVGPPPGRGFFPLRQSAWRGAREIIPHYHAPTFSQLRKQAGVTSGKSVTRDVPRFSARFSLHPHGACSLWFDGKGEQYGVVWCMRVALLDVSGSLDGSVAGCERVLDVSVSLDVTLRWW